MAYKVFVKSGKSTSGSTLLVSKLEVDNWIKKNPLGNSRTNYEVTDLFTNKTYKRKKYTSYNKV